MIWACLQSGACEPALNMAWDEALLEAMPRLQQVVLRFYSWTEPAATFGYFQKHNEVQRLTLLRPLVRRPTGGGIVPHDADWTYSLAVPPSDPWYSLTAVRSYHRIHDWIRRAFAGLGVSCVLAPQALQSGPGQCFVGYEQYDLLWGGRKIAGAAQRRSLSGLLIQGSVQPPAADCCRSEWESSMRQTAAAGGLQWTMFDPDSLLLRRVRELALSKYSRDEWNCKK